MLNQPENKQGIRIAINATSAVYGGGVTYLDNLFEHLQRIDEKNAYYIFTNAAYERRFKKSVNSYFIFISVKRIKSAFVRMLWEQMVLPWQLWKYKIDILFSPANVISFFAPCRQVVMVQNLAPFLPEQEYKDHIYQRIRLRFLRYLTLLSVRWAHNIIFISQHTQKVLSRWHARTGQRTYLIYHGCHHSFSAGLARKQIEETKKKFNIQGEYIFCVSHVYRYKNILELVEAFAEIPQQGESPPRLVIAGVLCDLVYYQRILKAINEKSLNDRVLFLQHVPQDHLPGLYAGCRLFIYPSTCEALGLPFLEAMSCGAVIAASNMASIPEICQDAAVYFDPRNPDEIAQTIRNLLDNEKLRDQLRQKALQRAQDFSWERTARQTRAVFEETARRERTGFRKIKSFLLFLRYSNMFYFVKYRLFFRFSILGIKRREKLYCSNQVAIQDRVWPRGDKMLLRSQSVNFWQRLFSRRITTGGTTGEPVKFYEYFGVCFLETFYINYIFYQAGWRPGKRTLVLRGERIGDVPFRVFGNMLVVSSYTMLDYLPAILTKIRAFRPTWIYAYPSVFWTFFQAARGEFDMKAFEGCLFGSEKLYAFQKAEMLRANPELKIAEWYGMSEKAVLCYRIHPQKHFNLLKSYSQVTLVPEDGLYRVFGTSLIQAPTQVLNYDTGDYVRLDDQNRIIEIVGREQEFIHLKSGRRLPFSQALASIHSAVWSYIDRWQLIQKVPGRIDFYIELKDIKNRETVTSQFNDLFSNLIDQGLDIEYHFDNIKSELTTARGKQRYFIQNIK